MKMRVRVMTAVANVVVHRPFMVLAVAGILTIGAFGIGKNLKLKASKMDFLPPEDPAVVQYESFIDSFGALNSVLIILEGPVEKMRAFADEAGPALDGLEKWVRSVTYKLDIEQYKAQGLVLQSPDQLEKVYADLMDAGPLLRALSERPTMGNFLEFISVEMGDEDAVAPEIPRLIENVRFVHRPLVELSRVLDGSRPEDLVLFPKLKVSREDLKRMNVDENGYLISADNEYLLMVVNPATHMDRDDIIEAFLEDFHHVVDPILAKYPEVHLGKAGSPIRDLEEEDTVDADLKRTSLTAGAGIFLISIVAFGGLFPAALILLVLIVIVVFTAAATQLLVGHLNLISAVFVAILFGLGHDFGNYVIILSREWLPSRGLMAYRDAIVTAGSSLLTAALTTCAAFYSLLLHDFVAFNELGLIAGTGVLIAYVAMLTILPAALVAKAQLMGQNLEGGDDESSHPRRLLLSRGLVAAAGYKKSILVIFLGGLALSLPFVHKNPFEFEMANLMPAGGPSVVYEDILREKFSITSDFNVIMSDSMKEVYAVADQLETSKVVQTIDSLAYLIPRDLDEKADLLERIKLWAQWIGYVEHEAPVSTVDEMIDGLRRLGNALKNPRRLANLEDSKELHAEIDRLKATIDALILELSKMEEPGEGVAFLEEKIVTEVEDVRNFMWNAATVNPYTLETLPEEQKRRFIGNDGTLVTYVTPAIPLSAEADAARFYEATHSVDAGVTGIPVVVYRIMGQIKLGWLNAALWALVGICVMIIIDFRRPVLAALAVLPLFCGGMFMSSLMYAMGVKWNVLNSVALPILVGVGIDYGVNLLHRYLMEGDLEIAVGSTGRAIFYSAATSCMGFGSLMMARHRGLASFGLTLFTGVLFSMLAALLLLPATLALSDRNRGTAPSTDDPPDPAS